MSSGYVGFQALKAMSLTMLRLIGLDVTSLARRMNSTLLVSVCLKGSSSLISWQDIPFVRAIKLETSMSAKGGERKQSGR